MFFFRLLFMHRARLFSLSVSVGARTHIYIIFAANKQTKRLPAARSHFSLRRFEHL